MAERLPSRTEIRMSIGFMNNTTTTADTPPSHEAVFDHATAAAAEERSAERRREPCPQQRCSSRGVNAVHLLPGPHAYGNATASAFAAANERAPRPSTSRARGTQQQVNMEHHHGHTFGSSWPAAATGMPTTRGAGAAAWPSSGQDGFHTPPGPQFVGDSTPANNWVRFAWEPLPGGAEYDATALVFPSEMATAGDGNSEGSRSVPGGRTGRTMLLRHDELSEGPAHRNSDESVGVKRSRPEAGQSSSIGGRRYEGGEKHMDWTKTPPGSSRLRCLPGLEQFAVAGATRQAARTLQPPLDARPRTSRAFAEAAGRRTGTGHSPPPPAAGERLRRGCAPGGNSTRSSSWGGDLVMGPTRQEQVMASHQVQWTSGGTAATTYRQQQEQEQEQQEQQQRQQQQEEQQGYVQARYSSDSHETGRSAKKPRHHRLRVQRVLSAGHMDSLADGVSSLGVASPQAAAGVGSSSGGWNQADAPRTPHGCTWQRDSFGGQADGSSQPPCPVSALDGGNPGGGVARAGGGAYTGHTRTTRSRGVPPGAGMGGVEHLRSRKRRSGSISTSASYTRTVRTPSVLPAEGTLAGMDTTSSSSSAAAPFRRRLRRGGVGHATVNVAGAATTAAVQKGAAGTCGVQRTMRDLGMASPSSLGLPRTSSTLARLMQQGGGKEAPGFDAAVRASAASFGGNVGVDAAAAAVADAIDAVDDDKSSSSDGCAAHEDLSAWLHSTHDWWTSD